MSRSLPEHHPLTRDVDLAIVRIVLGALKDGYENRRLKQVAQIHNGKGLKVADRDRSGAHFVYAAGGIAGRHSERLTDEPFVVIGRKGSAGKVTYGPKGGWVIDTAYYAQPVDPRLLHSKFLYYAISSLDFRDDIIATAVPGINRTAIYRHTIPVPPIDIQLACVRFLDAAIDCQKLELPPLPPQLERQRSLITRVNQLIVKTNDVRRLQDELRMDTYRLLLSAYADITRDVEWLPMAEVAPLQRRPVQVRLIESFAELGVRSFGKGTFHKPSLTGVEVGNKRLFRIEPGDLVFNIVFAWEGAVAVARPEDKGRVGSHRFLTCVPNDRQALSSFLQFHFLTERGLEQLGNASPGGAGRNRTLGIKALAQTKVPVPPFEDQQWFDSLSVNSQHMLKIREEIDGEIRALESSILSAALNGSF